MQKDLFGSSATVIPNSGNQKTDFLERYRFSLRLDQSLVLIIMMLVVFVLVFSFGVETGKRYAMAELKAERAKREQMAQEFREKVFANVSQGRIMLSKDEALKTVAEQSASTDSAVPAVAVQTQTMNESGESEGMTPMESSATATTETDTTALATASDTPAAISAVNSTGAANTDKYTIQLATHTSKSFAEQEVKRFSNKGYQGFIIPKGKFFQVCLNNFETRNKADVVMKQLKGKGVIPSDAYVRLV